MAEHSAMSRINWSSADIAGTFSLFKQKCQILFAVKEIKRENMVNYIGESGEKWAAIGKLLGK